MPDFLITPPCGRLDCKHFSSGTLCGTVTNSISFGLCDDPPPSTSPAYVQHYSPDDWIATINNPAGNDIQFKAVDNCIDLQRHNGDLESRCDGFLKYNGNTLIFIELKDRESSGWLCKGREQLTNTIEKFAQNHNVSHFIMRKAYVCNKQRPFAIAGINTEVQKFKNDTASILNNSGLLLKAERSISLS